MSRLGCVGGTCAKRGPAWLLASFSGVCVAAPPRFSLVVRLHPYRRVCAGRMGQPAAICSGVRDRLDRRAGRSAGTGPIPFARRLCGVLDPNDKSDRHRQHNGHRPLQTGALRHRGPIVPPCRKRRQAYITARKYPPYIPSIGRSCKTAGPAFFTWIRQTRFMASM